MTIKHVPGVTLASDFGVATPDSERAEILRTVFPDNGTGPEAFNATIVAKLQFLIKGRLKILPNSGAISVLIKKFQANFNALHYTLQQVVSFQEDWADALELAPLLHFDSFKTNPHSFETMDDLHQFQADCESALKALEAAVSEDEDESRFDAIDSDHLKRKGIDVINAINQLPLFPTYENILDSLKKALAKPSSKWAAQSAVIEYEPYRSKGSNP
jgi:hypothetical protein